MNQEPKQELFEIAKFLGNVWSGKKVEVVISRKIEVPSCYRDSKDKNKIIIFLPIPSKNPTYDFITNYRLWRFSLWHEAMHVYFKTFEVDQFHSSKLQTLLNIIEDYRIEIEGLKVYRGMIKERLLSQMIFYTLLPPPTDNLTAYAHLLLMSKCKTRVPENVKEAVKYTILALKKGVPSNEIAKKVAEMLEVDTSDQIPNFRNQIQKKVGKKVLLEKIEEENKMKLKKLIEEVDSEIIDEVEIIWRRRHEKKDIEGVIFKVPEILNINIREYINRDLQIHLLNIFSKLRCGYSEFLSDSGEFDTENYVNARKPFIEERVSGTKKLKFIFILDHSSSIVGYDKSYKIALINLSEVLYRLGIKFEIYAFTTERDLIIHVIKEKEIWTTEHARRIASVIPSGGTPLDTVYKGLLNRLNETLDRNTFVITLTDGEVSDVADTAEEVKKFRKKGVKTIGIGFGKNLSDTIKIAERLEKIGYDFCISVGNLDELSSRILKFIEKVSL